jgi:2'-5' RNA ligase
MRLFLAINLPAAERARIHEAAAPLRRARLPVRWVDVDALHLTLKFLGEVPDARKDAIVEAGDTVAARFAAFRLELGELGAFPRLSNPRVVWVGVRAPPELGGLASELDGAMATLGFPPEARPFSPHLTLGRAEREARAPDFRALGDLAADFPYAGSVEVRSVDLMRSHLSPRGARYERLHAAPLSGGARPEGAPASGARPAGGDTSSGETGP